MNKASIYAHGFMILLTITAANSFCSEHEIYTEIYIKPHPYTVQTAKGYKSAVKKLFDDEIQDLRTENKPVFFIPSVSYLSPHTIFSGIGLFKLLSPYTGENTKGLALAVGGTLCGIFAINTLWNKFCASQTRYENSLELQGKIKALENFQTTKLTQIKIEE